MLPALWLSNASSTPSELGIRQGEQVLGRSPDADICLDETYVSGYHARLNWYNGQLTVLDLDSTNGTLVNGVSVIGWTSLTDGDIIEFGGVEATVRLPSMAEPNRMLTPAPPPPAPSSQRRRAVPRPDSVDPTVTSPLNRVTDNGKQTDDQADSQTNGHEDETGNDRSATEIAAEAVEETAGEATGETAAETDGESGVIDLTDKPVEMEPIDTAADEDGRVHFDSRLGPMVSDQTEPLFDRPLTSAVTLPPTPPGGVTMPHFDVDSTLDGDLGGRDFGDRGFGERDFADSDFDFGDHNNESSKTALFDNRGLRMTIGTAVVVFISLALVVAIIIFLMQS